MLQVSAEWPFSSEVNIKYINEGVKKWERPVPSINEYETLP